MRLFLALPLPARLQAELAAVGAAIPGLGAQRPETLHVTLRFLGEVADPAPVADAVRGVAAKHAPFSFELERIGGFPNARRARVVWVGVGAGELNAGALASGIGSALQPLGFEPERRPWKGHVTLGRFRKGPRPVPDTLDRRRKFGRVEADRVVLYRSTLTPEGARHEALAELSLLAGT